MAPCARQCLPGARAASQGDVGRWRHGGGGVDNALSWVYLTTAPDQLVAEMWRDLLLGEGIASMIPPGDTMTSYLGVSPYPCGIMVHGDDLGRAKEALGLITEPGSA